MAITITSSDATKIRRNLRNKMKEVGEWPPSNAERGVLETVFTTLLGWWETVNVANTLAGRIQIATAIELAAPGVYNTNQKVIIGTTFLKVVAEKELEAIVG